MIHHDLHFSVGHISDSDFGTPIQNSVRTDVLFSSGKKGTWRHSISASVDIEDSDDTVQKRDKQEKRQSWAYQEYWHDEDLIIGIYQVHLVT